MPTLEWIGKDRVVNHHKDVPYRTLERIYSYDPDGRHEEDNGSGNMVIHGDNLDALKALLPRYEGRVDLIYIDPPYNTGNASWVYSDRVDDPTFVRWLGSVVDSTDLSRHDKWLCMMYPRLVEMRKLLSNNGVIFISIDGNEVSNLRSICDDIFGPTCFVNIVSWQRTYSPRNDSHTIVNEVEYILVYSKSAGWEPRRLARTEKMDAIYKSPDGDPRAWMSDNASAPGAKTHRGMVYAIQHPMTGELIYPTNGRCWGDGQDVLLSIMNEWCEYELRDLNDAERRAEVCGVPVGEVPESIGAIVLSKSLEESKKTATDVYNRGIWPRLYFTEGGKGGIRKKRYLDSAGGRVVTNLWPYDEVGHTDEAKKEIKSMIGVNEFDTPKPLRLMERILRIASDPDSVVLDAFAGTASMAHAVMRLNAEDGGRRRFIMVEVMDYAETVTAARLERAIDGYRSMETVETVIFSKELRLRRKEEDLGTLAEAWTAYEDCRKDGGHLSVSKPRMVDGSVRVVAKKENPTMTNGIPGDFSYYELGPAIVGPDGMIDPSVPAEDVRAYVFHSETGEAHVPDPDNPFHLGSVAGTGYYMLYDGVNEHALDTGTLDMLSPGDSAHVVYADRCLLEAAELRARSVTFRKIPRDVRRFRHGAQEVPAGGH